MGKQILKKSWYLTVALILALGMVTWLPNGNSYAIAGDGDGADTVVGDVESGDGEIDGGVDGEGTGDEQSGELDSEGSGSEQGDELDGEGLDNNSDANNENGAEGGAKSNTDTPALGNAAPATERRVATTNYTLDVYCGYSEYGLGSSSGFLPWYGGDLDTPSVIRTDRNFSCDTSRSVGTVVMYATLNGESVPSFDTTVEGEYVLTFVNTDAAAQGTVLTETRTYYAVRPEVQELVFVNRGDTVALASGSYWSVTSALDMPMNDGPRGRDEEDEMLRVVPGVPDAPDFLTVSNGVALFDSTNAASGTHLVRLVHDFDTPEGAMPEHASLKTLEVVVYDVEDDIQGTIAGSLSDIGMTYDQLWEMLHAGTSTEEELEALINALQVRMMETYGTEGDYEAVMERIATGETITTRVEIDEAEVPEEAKVAIMEYLGGDYDSIEFHEINVGVYLTATGERIATLNKLANEEWFEVSVSGAATGYTREFRVVTYHDGVVREIDCTYDKATGILGFGASEFSTFAILYKDVLTPVAPETGAFTGEAASASSSNIVTIVAGVLAAVVLAGVATFAKRK